MPRTTSRKKVLPVVVGVQREELGKLLDSYQNMIRSQAYGVWWKLPPWLRTWLSPEDMSAEATYNVWSVLIDPRYKYDKTRSSYTTFIFAITKNNLRRQVMGLLCQKRGAFKTENALEHMPETASLDADAYRPKRSAYNQVESSSTLDKIYRQSSTELRADMVEWFSGKIPTNLLEDHKSIREFRRLSRHYGLKREDVALLLHVTRTGPVL